MVLVRVALVMAAGVLALFAQAPPAAGKKQPEATPGILHAVTVEGNHIYSTEAIVKVLGLTIGQPVTTADFKAANDRLNATELFSNISYQFSFIGKPPAYDLIFTLAEYDQVFPIRFEELGVPDEAVKQYLREHIVLYNDRIPGTAGILKRYRQAVQDVVSEKNPNLKIRARVTNEDPKQLTVLFRPDFPAPVISRVVVTGSKAIPPQAIAKAINEIAVGQPYTDARLNEILNTQVKRLYEVQGYVNVSFPKIEGTEDKTVKGYVVNVTVQEGPKYTFGPMKFRGGDLEEDDVKKMLKFKPGDPFNVVQVEDLRGDLISALKRKGHLDANVETSRTIDDQKRTVNEVFALEPGPQYTFQTLEIYGLDLEGEPVVRKMWGELPGKAFNPEYPAFFLKKVEQAQLFDNLGNTRSDFLVNETTHGVTVSLYFRGSSPEQRRKLEQKERDRQAGQGQPPDNLQ
jgi:outer membrane protein insertion porin family